MNKKTKEMPLRFVGGEQLQRGRGIGGIFRFIKSIFAPAVKTVGKSVVGAVKSTTGKKILNVLKDQAIDTSMNLAQDVLKGNNVKSSLQDEVNDLKTNLSSLINELRKTRKRSSDTQEGSGIMRKSLKRTKRRRTKLGRRKKDFFNHE